MEVKQSLVVYTRVELEQGLKTTRLQYFFFFAFTETLILNSLIMAKSVKYCFYVSMLLQLQ
jgi:hypothetical protein